MSHQPVSRTKLPGTAATAVMAACPVETAGRIVGQKWTLQIVNQLLNTESMRFCEIQEALGGVNPSTLSSRLKMLEEEGLVQRVQVSNVPPHVEYNLTAMGLNLEGVIDAICTWSSRWLCNDVEPAPRVSTTVGCVDR